jgi:hypothetical protein
MKLKKALLFILLSIKPFVALIAMSLFIIITLQYIQLYQGNEIDLFLTIYLTIEFVLSIMYLLLAEYVKTTNESYQIKSGDTFNIPQYKHSSEDRNDSDDNLTDKEIEEIKNSFIHYHKLNKHHLEDKIDNKKIEEVAHSFNHYLNADEPLTDKEIYTSKLFEYTHEGKLFQFRIWQDGTVYRLDTSRYVGYFVRGKRRFGIQKNRKRKSFGVDKLIRELFVE